MEVENLKIKQDIDIMNTTINELTIALLDKFYPIGSYYETSDIGFDPNVSWGGTWTQDTIGLSTIAANTGEDPEIGTLNTRVDLAVGNTIGEKKHTLTINEMPKHKHGAKIRIGWGAGGLGSGWARVDANDPKTAWTADINETGGSVSHNNVQPSIGVIRWHRTA